MKEEIDEIFENSELVYQVRKHFDEESGKEMIEELKTKIIKLCDSYQRGQGVRLKNG